jgi:hypothetical protein
MNRAEPFSQCIWRAVAAERASDTAKAKQYYKQLLQICERGDKGGRRA